MKMHALVSIVWVVGLLLALNGALMVSARQSWHAPKTMFVFGDSYVDNGNLPRTDPVDKMSRQWYKPYGISRMSDDGGWEPKATGRFSDFMVQSDFIANMMGLPRSPPAYQSTIVNYCDPSGMNFAYGDSGVHRFEFQLTTLGEQINVFKGLIDSGTISHNHVTHSIALVAISGHGYMHHSNLGRYIMNVTNEIASSVERLRNLGVKRVLVNNMHPLGCTPFQTWPSDYDACDPVVNTAATVHNKNLKKKLGAKKGVFIVDLNTAFAQSFDQFENSRGPCCVAKDPKAGYCGQQDENSEPLYSLCPDSSKFFFWDDTHPTHAAWQAVSKKLEGPIKSFIGL